MFLNVEEMLAKTTDGSTNDTNKKGYNFGFILLSCHKITGQHLKVPLLNDRKLFSLYNLCLRYSI
jgi:hypothetical protein